LTPRSAPDAKRSPREALLNLSNERIAWELHLDPDPAKFGSGPGTLWAQ
jgi:hypothetical protein